VNIQRKEKKTMLKIRKTLMTLIMVVWMILLATPSFARSFSMKDAGLSLWVFIIIGAVIILLQLIPATILFFSFIGSASTMTFRRKKISEKDELKKEEKMAIPGYGPLTVEK
jgi:hypothetical protein